jgi:hypothetical protein
MGNLLLSNLLKSICLDLHQTLADSEFASKLLYFKQISSFWSIIVMDYVENLISIDSLSMHREQIVPKLDEILQLMKSRNFVHGDFRSSNLFGEMPDARPEIQRKCFCH